MTDNKDRELIEYKGQPAYKYANGCIKHAETGRFMKPADSTVITAETATEYHRLNEAKKAEAILAAQRGIGDIDGWENGIKHLWSKVVLDPKPNMTSVKGFEAIGRAANLLPDRRVSAAGQPHITAVQVNVTDELARELLKDLQPKVTGNTERHEPASDV